MNWCRGCLTGIANSPKRLVWAIIGTWVVCSLGFALFEWAGPITSLWWGIVTASTTGYGDYSPHSTPGRLVGAVLMVSFWFLNLAAQAHLIKSVMHDPDAWTDEEQRDLIKTTHENNEMLKQLLAQHRQEQPVRNPFRKRRPAERPVTRGAQPPAPIHESPLDTLLGWVAGSAPDDRKEVSIETPKPDHHFTDYTPPSTHTYGGHGGSSHSHDSGGYSHSHHDSGSSSSYSDSGSSGSFDSGSSSF